MDPDVRIFSVRNSGTGVPRRGTNDVRPETLQSPGDRIAGTIGAKMAGLDADTQMSAQFGVGMADAAQRRFDRLGYHQPHPFSVRGAFAVAASKPDRGGDL